MNQKPIKIQESENKVLESFQSTDNCKVSKASKDIMLDRFYNGKDIQFPFST